MDKPDTKLAGLLPAPAPEPADAPTGRETELNEEVDRLRQAIRELQTKLARDRETVSLWREFQPKFVEFLIDLLEVLDNFERAEEAARGQASIRSIAEGLTAVRRQMLSALERREIRPFNPLGEEFHPDLHQILDAPAGELFPPLKVTEVLRPGYKIGEQILRKAWVRVEEAGETEA
jgi:molecular chaperone GrpE